MFRKFVGSFSDIHHSNPPDPVLLASPVSFHEIMDEINFLVRENFLRKMLEDKLRLLSREGYIFVYATVDKRVEGDRSSLIEVDEKGLFAVRGDEKLLVYRVVLRHHYVEGRLMYSSKHLVPEPV